MSEINEVWQERMELCFDRLREISGELSSLENPDAFENYFKEMTSFEGMLEDTLHFIQNGEMRKASVEELAKRNYALYQDILPGHYESSFANPQYSVSLFEQYIKENGYKGKAEELGRLLSAVYMELRWGIGFIYDGDYDEQTIRMELLLEVYNAYCAAKEDDRCLSAGEVKDILYWFVSDYAQDACLKKVRNMVVPGTGCVGALLNDMDESTLRHLYYYGEYISQNELDMAAFLQQLPESEVQKMADTFTEGYRIGFVMTGKDLSKKSTADLRYPIGFERMARLAVDNLTRLKLSCVYRRPINSLLYNPGQGRLGYTGTCPNRQLYFDHRNDRALILDGNYVNRLLESQKEAFEHYKTEARGYAGPAVVESFGEAAFDPIVKSQAVVMNAECNKKQLDLSMKMGSLTRKYILEEERSFTIIAFPIPDIIPSLNPPTMERFGEFFREIIAVNTLDYNQYQTIQSCIINALNQADYCKIKGMNGNRTDLRVNLYKLTNPDKQTIFENCVADVNIPVGEVFTSPVLKGTSGTLHVTKVYLNGLEFRDLELNFSDGKITTYSCKNFEKEEDNKRFIEENILFRHETLPMGEFAIGTNTRAYVAAREFGVEDKLPILIAEKTGPHFAVGDTCYSGAEDIPVFNPDGKEIVARDNEISLLRKEDESKAYFNCHTDITIPYEELGSLDAVRPDGSIIPILKDGRFVLPGTEALNEVLDEKN